MSAIDDERARNPQVQNWGNGKYTFELFPQEYIDLNLELCTGFHPKLEKIIQGYPMDAMDIKLAQIAAYCEVMLDGDYTLESRRDLCRILKERLILLREDPNASVILLPN